MWFTVYNLVLSERLTTTQTYTVVSLSLLPSRSIVVRGTSNWNRRILSAGHCPLQGYSKSKGVRGHWPRRSVSWSRHLLSKHLRCLCTCPSGQHGAFACNINSCACRAFKIPPPAQPSFPITVVLEGLFLKHRPTPALWVGF